MKADFEKKLEENGFSHHCNTIGLYSLGLSDDTNRSFQVQFISSEPVDESVLGSCNGNSVKSIGHFKFRLSIGVNEPDFYIFAFSNTKTHSKEYIIIPAQDIRRRLAKESQIATGNKEIEIVFWLMPDKRLFETKSKGIEWEWYFLSKGRNGRLADRTDYDYTEFLNDWNRLKMK